MAKNPDQDKLIAEIKKADNILVALSANPTIDELASALGLTLMLNKNKRRAVAIFSGQIPDVLGFLNMSETFDVNADGLRDFIVTLDAKKADRVVCRAENGMVKVYITPSGSIVSSKDLEFSQGDYNVDLVIAIGVSRKEDLDQALAAHGRILHSASVVSLTIGDKTSKLGSLNIHDPKASSYAEMLFELEKDLDADLAEGEEPAMDQAVATAFLTGIVSVTDRFSNNKTTAEIMALVAELMKFGANQQLVASELAKDKAEVVASDAKSAPQQEVDLQLDKSNQQVKTDTLDLKSAKPEQPQEAALPPEAEAVVEPPVTMEVEPEEEKIKPTIDNLEAYNAQQMETERTQVAQEIMTRLEQEQATPAQPTSEPAAEVAAQVAELPTVPAETVASAEASSVSADDQLAQQLEQASVAPESNLINRFNDAVTAQPAPAPSTVTNPDPSIVFGQEVVDDAPTVAWGQALPANEPLVEDSVNTSEPIIGARRDEKVIQPLEPAPAVAPLPPEEVQPAAPAPVAEPAPLDLPPLPDFSAFNVAPPAPPVPPSFDTPPMPPQFDPASLAQPTPETNPFDQYGQNLQTAAPVPEPLPSASPQPPASVSPVTYNPVMQDQVYPNTPPDKSQFVIPE